MGAISLLIIAIAACTPPPAPTTPSCPAAPAAAAAAETKLGYFSYNGRCPSFGIQFSETPHVDPVIAEGRLCVVFPPIENLPIENQMKHDVIAAMIDKHVRVSFAKVDEGTIHVSAVEPAP